MSEYVFDHGRLDVDKRSIKLVRIVSMLIPMAIKFDNIPEPEKAITISSNCEFDAEHRLWLSTNRK